MSEEKIDKYKRICKISFIVELILFICIVGVHGAIEKRRMGTDLKEHYMEVVDIEKSVSESYDSNHTRKMTYKVKYAVMINGEETWFYSGNPQLDYTLVNKGSKVKIYEYKGQYSTKLDTFTVKGVYRILLIINFVAAVITVFIRAIVKLYDVPKKHYNG